MSLKAKAPRGSSTDTLRDEFESNRAWKLRKKFLDANVDSLSEDRLVCLSKCFTNSAMYGCAYPPLVMREIDSRSGGLLESYQQEAREDRILAAKKRYAISFVKASDSHSTVTKHHTDLQNGTNNVHSNGTCVHQPSEVEIIDMVNYQGEGDKPDDTASGTSNETGNLPITSTDQLPGTDAYDFLASAIEKLHITSDNLSGVVLTTVHAATPILPLQEYRKMSLIEVHPLLKKLRQLAVYTLDIDSKEDYSLNKVMNSVTKGFGVKVTFKLVRHIANQLGETYATAVFFNDCLVATGAARSKALARKIAMEVALQKLYLPYLRIAETESGNRQEIQASIEPFDSVYDGQRYGSTDKPLPSNLTAKHSVGLTFPGKVLISSKDSLPHYLFQFSKRAPLRPIEAIGSKLNKKLTSIKSPLTKHSSNYKPISKLNPEKVLNRRSWPDIKKFILVQHSRIKETSAVILRRSADFSGMVLDIEHTVHSPVSVSCKVRLEGKVISAASESSIWKAKYEAGRRALDYLGQQCWVLKLKGVDTASVISKGGLFKQIQQRTDVIGESNLGYKMLRKMGWTGGGIGKGNKGIVEPISLSITRVRGRPGLGLSPSSAPKQLCAEFEERLFRQKVCTSLRNYIASEQQDDLRFDPEFSIEERKIIHEEASKCHLQTDKNNPWMTVGRKRSSQQLLQYIKDCGGETNSYILLPPGSYQNCP